MKAIWKRVPPAIRWILLLLIVSRTILCGIGVASQILLYPYHGHEYVWHYSPYLILDIWGVWDTGWYLNIAEHGYSAELGKDDAIYGQANYAFFPLYPLLMRALGLALGNTFVAGIILSNLFLFLACWFLYRLMQLDQDEESALRAVKYLILFPTAFIFSGVFTESLFVLLLIACFYFAKCGKWRIVGALGFFLALTRSVGVLAIIPLALIYGQSIGFRLRHMERNVFWLLCIPLGLAVFALYNFKLTGDALAFVHIQATWNRKLLNPFALLAQNLAGVHLDSLFSSYMTLGTITLLTLFCRRIGLAYWLLGMYSIFVPLTTGLQSMPRYLLVIFPLYILLASFTRNPRIDQLMTVALALIQGFLMVFWSNGFSLIV